MILSCSAYLSFFQSFLSLAYLKRSSKSLLKINQKYSIYFISSSSVHFIFTSLLLLLTIIIFSFDLIFSKTSSLVAIIAVSQSYYSNLSKLYIMILFVKPFIYPVNKVFSIVSSFIFYFSVYRSGINFFSMSSKRHF